MPPQLSCGNICQIGMWSVIVKQCLIILKTGRQQNEGHWFSNHHPDHLLVVPTHLALTIYIFRHFCDTAVIHAARLVQAWLFYMFTIIFIQGKMINHTCTICANSWTLEQAGGRFEHADEDILMAQNVWKHLHTLTFYWNSWLPIIRHCVPLSSTQIEV